VAKAREGKTVVRLKGGDPIFSAAVGRKRRNLPAAHVAFEVVPGVSSIVAGPNYAGIPLTHRDHCSSFTVIRSRRSSKEGSSIDFESLAKIPGTKVVLMGVERIGQLADSLMQHGMSPDTPVGMVRWGTTGRQQSIEGTWVTSPKQSHKSSSPLRLLQSFGDVVKLRSKLNWFEKRPLFGRRIVVTRNAEQASQLSRQLHELGADVLEIPPSRSSRRTTIRISSMSWSESVL